MVRAMKRSPLPKHTKRIVTKPVRTVNPERRSAEFVRCYGSEDRVAFVRNSPCVVCGKRPCENVHIATGGMGRKGDAETIVPMCSADHHELHSIGVRTFETKHSISLYLAAKYTQRTWDAYLRDSR